MSVKFVLLFLAIATFAIPAVVGLVSSTQTQTAATSATMPDFAQLEGFTPPAGFDRTIALDTEANTSTTISALGTIEANEVADVSFMVSGEVAEILVNVGDSVNAGDLLAWLDGMDAQVNYDTARLNLERARINLDELYEPPDESTLRVADANIASAQAAYSDAANTVSSADVESAQLRYQQALNTYNAEAAARANMNGTEEEIALQDAAVGAASFELEIARLQLEELQNPDSSSGLPGCASSRRSFRKRNCWPGRRRRKLTAPKSRCSGHRRSLPKRKPRWNAPGCTRPSLAL